MARALPCGTSLQYFCSSLAHASFMGYWKSMFSEKRTWERGVMQAWGSQQGATFQLQSNTVHPVASTPACLPAEFD
jgi:hypothetical protein